MFAFIRAVEEFPVEKLDSHDRKDEMEEHINNEDIEDVLERVDNAVKDSFQFRHSLDRFQWSQHAQHSQRFDGAQVLSCRAPPAFLSRTGVEFSKKY